MQHEEYRHCCTNVSAAQSEDLFCTSIMRQTPDAPQHLQLTGSYIDPFLLVVVWEAVDSRSRKCSFSACTGKQHDNSGKCSHQLNNGLTTDESTHTGSSWGALLQLLPSVEQSWA
eukprot:scaffold57074_cov21-Tisochrysis_lutea.AAC.1